MLKITNEKVIEVSDWDKFITETYGKPYSFQQQDGCKSRGTYSFRVPLDYEPERFERDSVPEIVNGEEMGVSFEAWLKRNPKTPVGGATGYSIGLWWNRNSYPHIDEIIENLYAKGLIEKGDYLINIDW